MGEPQGVETDWGNTMKTTTTLGIVLCMAGASGYAKDFDGKLIDASCYLTRSTSTASGQKPVKLDKIDKDCAPTSSTTTFAVLSDDKIYKLDDATNARIAEDRQRGKIKADKDGDVHISVSGKLEGDTIVGDKVKGHD
jgi:hypothetical protein